MNYSISIVKTNLQRIILYILLFAKEIFYFSTQTDLCIDYNFKIFVWKHFWHSQSNVKGTLHNIYHTLHSTFPYALYTWCFTKRRLCAVFNKYGVGAGKCASRMFQFAKRQKSAVSILVDKRSKSLTTNWLVELVRMF